MNEPQTNVVPDRCSTTRRHEHEDWDRVWNHETRYGNDCPSANQRMIIMLLLLALMMMMMNFFHDDAVAGGCSCLQT
jgi:hypothetical protein